MLVNSRKLSESIVSWPVEELKATGVVHHWRARAGKRRPKLKAKKSNPAPEITIYLCAGKRIALTGEHDVFFIPGMDLAAMRAA
jgi:hypothetical protein